MRLVRAVEPLKNQILKVTFDDNAVKYYDVKQLYLEYPDYELLSNSDIFNLVQVDCGGHAVVFTDELDIPEVELWENGVTPQYKTVNRSLYKNGQGRYGGKINLPYTWLQELGISEEDQTLNLEFNGEEIVISKAH